MKSEPLDNMSDGGLLRRALAGEWTAFETLTSRYERAVYSLAFRILWDQRQAELVTERTFFTAMESLRSCRRESSFASWLLDLAGQEILKLARRKPGFGMLTRGATLAPEKASAASDEPKLAPPLARLADPLQLVFLLRNVEGLSVRETAQALGLSEAGVRSRITRVRGQMDDGSRNRRAL